MTQYPEKAARECHQPHDAEANARNPGTSGATIVMTMVAPPITVGQAMQPAMFRGSTGSL